MVRRPALVDLPVVKMHAAPLEFHDVVFHEIEVQVLISLLRRTMIVMVSM